MIFQYDRKKSEANKAKHGIDFEEAKALWNVGGLVARGDCGTKVRYFNFMTTFWGIQAGTLETQGLRTAPVRFWLVAFLTRSKAQFASCFRSRTARWQSRRTPSGGTDVKSLW